LPALAAAFLAHWLLKALEGGEKTEQKGVDEFEPDCVDDEGVTTGKNIDLAEDPYHPSFWEDVTEHAAAEGPLSSEQISADIYLKCVLHSF